MSSSVNGMRGTGSYSEGQRPTSFGGGIKVAGKSRVTREDVAAKMREVHRNVPRTVKKAGKKGKAKEAMLRAIAFSKAEREEQREHGKGGEHGMRTERKEHGKR